MTKTNKSVLKFKAIVTGYVPVDCNSIESMTNATRQIDTIRKALEAGNAETDGGNIDFKATLANIKVDVDAD